MEIENIHRLNFEDLNREALKARVGDSPIRIRIQPSTYVRPKGHAFWPKICWTILCTNLDEVKQFRKALDAFFEALSRGGAERVIEGLKAIQ